MKSDATKRGHLLGQILARPEQVAAACTSPELAQNMADFTDFAFFNTWNGQENPNARLGSEQIQRAWQGTLAAPFAIRIIRTAA